MGINGKPFLDFCRNRRNNFIYKHRMLCLYNITKRNICYRNKIIFTNQSLLSSVLRCYVSCYACLVTLLRFLLRNIPHLIREIFKLILSNKWSITKRKLCEMIKEWFNEKRFETISLMNARYLVVELKQLDFFAEASSFIFPLLVRNLRRIKVFV